MPSTRPISSCESPPANFSATSSRSRGVEPPERGAHGLAAERAVHLLVGAGAHARPRARPRASARRLRRRSSSSAALRAMPKSHASSRAARGAEAAPLAEGALERLGRDLLGGGCGRAAASPRSRRRAGRRGGRAPRTPRKDVALAALEGAGYPFRNCFAHASTTLRPAFHHGLCSFFSYSCSRSRSAGARRRSRSAETSGRPSTSATPRSTRTCSACGRACRATAPSRRCGCASARRYYDRATETWHDVERQTAARRGSRSATRATSARQAGRKFHDRPAAADHELRGPRRSSSSSGGARAERSCAARKQVTLSGHPTGRHGDPCDYSAGALRDQVPVDGWRSEEGAGRS